MYHHELFVFGGSVNSCVPDVDLTEFARYELTKRLIVVSRDDGDIHAILCHLDDAPDDVVDFIGPMKTPLKTPQIERVTNKIQMIAVDVFQKC
jgi:hypothetical protein